MSIASDEVWFANDNICTGKPNEPCDNKKIKTVAFQWFIPKHFSFHLTFSYCTLQYTPSSNRVLFLVEFVFLYRKTLNVFDTEKYEIIER